MRTAHPSLLSSPVLTHLCNNISITPTCIGTRGVPDTIRMVEIVRLRSQLSICKQLSRPHEVGQLGHGLLWVVPFRSVEVTPENAAALHVRAHAGEIRLEGGGRGTYGYPAGLSNIKAYARGLKLGETQLSNDWPGC